MVSNIYGIFSKRVLIIFAALVFWLKQKQSADCWYLLSINVTAPNKSLCSPGLQSPAVCHSTTAITVKT